MRLCKKYTVPVGVGGAFAVMPELGVGLEFLLPGVLTGAAGDKAFDARYLGVFASYRTK